MGNLKISQLTSGNPAQSGDLIPIDRSGSNFSITAGSIAAVLGTALLNVQILTNTTANSTYTPTAGTTAFWAELVGGGGGSGGNNNAGNSNNKIASGGGGGGAWVGYFNNAVAVSYSYSCGGGGTAGTNAAGGAGGNTIFGNASNNCAYANAGGGGGATAKNGNSFNAAAGGTGGVPNTGLVLMPGEQGSPGWYPSNNTAVAGISVGGTGGCCPRGGQGGQPGMGSLSVPANGLNYGGGAGGVGGNNNTNATVGANGAQGAIIIWEFS